jgi:hypothetical protein
MAEKSKVWPALEAIGVEPGNIFETLQSVREQRINDLRQAVHMDAIDHYVDMIRDISLVLVDLELELKSRAITVPIYN